MASNIVAFIRKIEQDYKEKSKRNERIKPGTFPLLFDYLPSKHGYSIF